MSVENDITTLLVKLKKFLIERKFSVSTAESCTGGLIAKYLTDIDGSSSYFIGSVIAYANRIKSSVLNVSEYTLKCHGAVSMDVAKEMVLGVSDLMKSDIAISTTGIAGPGGGTDKKPVGTVCLGFKINESLFAEVMHFDGDRELVRKRTAYFALKYIYEKLLI